MWLKELNFLLEICLKELFFFSKNDTELNPSFFLINIWFNELINPYFKIWLKELNFFFCQETWLKELNLVSKNDSKNLTSFYMTQRIEPSFQQMAQIIETFFDSENWTSSFFQKYDSKNWTCFFQHDAMILFNTTQRIDFFFEYDSYNWTFLIRLKELIFFSDYDSKELNLFFWIWR